MIVAQELEAADGPKACTLYLACCYYYMQMFDKVRETIYHHEVPITCLTLFLLSMKRYGGFRLITSGHGMVPIVWRGWYCLVFYDRVL